MTGRKALDRPAKVEAIEGEVAINGPGRIGGSMTPKAASETGRRLQHYAKKAQGQGAWPDTVPKPE